MNLESVKSNVKSVGLPKTLADVGLRMANRAVLLRVLKGIRIEMVDARFLAGDDLAAYGWYSNKPTTLDFEGLRLQFDDKYIYMYKGFTAPEHRGQRLHAIGMTRALEAYLQRGYRGIVSYVEWNNFASLKSCYRMGYRHLGNVVIAGVRGHYILRHDAGCEALAFRVVRTSNGQRAA